MKTQIFFILVLIFIIGCNSNALDEEEVEEQIIIEEPIVKEVIKSEPSCPRGIINDPSPGICVLHQDKDNDNICDLSE